VVLNSLKSLNYKVQSKPLELYKLAGENMLSITIISGIIFNNGNLVFLRALLG
jgi:hypothetical protein